MKVCNEQKKDKYFPAPEFKAGNVYKLTDAGLTGEYYLGARINKEKMLVSLTNGNRWSSLSTFGNAIAGQCLREWIDVTDTVCIDTSKV